MYKYTIPVLLILSLFSGCTSTSQDSVTPTLSTKSDRPNTVPQTAEWVEEDNEWALGKRNKDGNYIGEWKWWLAPNGHLVCHTFFKGNSGGDFTYTRYHADGTFSRKGTYVGDEPHGVTISQKSDHPTTEIFHPRVDCWKAVSTFDHGVVVEEHYYNKQGKEIHKPFLGN